MDLGKMANIIKGKSDDNQAMKDASEKVILNRMLNKKLPVDNKTPLEMLKTVSQKSGINMPFLASNAFQEGMNNMINQSGGKSTDEFMSDIDVNASEEFPINGYKFYGLDTFGNIAPILKKKGYLPKDFSYDTYGVENEKGEEVTTANFRNNEDALTAKAAFMKHIRDEVQDYASKKNVKLEPKTMDYLMMSGFNGGLGNAHMMINELASGKFNQKDYVEKSQTSRKGIDKNVQPRLKKMGIFDKLTSGPVAPYNSPVPTFDDILAMVKNR